MVRLINGSIQKNTFDKIRRWDDYAHAQVQFEALLEKYPRRVVEATGELEEAQSLIVGYVENSWEGNIETGQRLPNLLARPDLSDVQTKRFDKSMFISSFGVKFPPFS